MNLLLLNGVRVIRQLIEEFSPALFKFVDDDVLLNLIKHTLQFNIYIIIVHLRIRS